jgi:iron complex outermembrane receptor protein
MQPHLRCVTALSILTAFAAAQDSGRSPSDESLTELSLEELMSLEVEVTSTRKSERVEDVPAAVYVLTAEDLRRSGASSIPEALRMVPGMQVARLDSNRWAISIRGFADQFANKLLVLIDGRTVYTPLFSGVFWDVQDVLLEDVERIEVIRGPGAALWGANAVNGVINVVTKGAAETQGPLLQFGGGVEEQAFGAARYGGQFGTDAAWRVYAKAFERDSFERQDGSEGEDDWHQARGGFRGDWSAGERDALTLQGDVYDGMSSSDFRKVLPVAPFLVTRRTEADVSGGDLIARWTRTLAESSELTLQGYYDRTDRAFDGFGEERDTFDLDFQHRFAPAEGHDLVWGAGWRSTTSDITEEDFNLSWGDDHRTDTLASAFVQDEIELEPDRWSLVLGTKLEHNDYTGFEVQPNLRALFRPDERQTVWGSVSRAIRSPSQAEDDVRTVTAVIPGVPFDTHVVVQGNDDLDPEELVAYELGYRRRVTETLSLDATVFYNDYDELITTAQGAPTFSGGVVIVPVSFENAGEATGRGFELATQWQQSESTRWNLGYSYLDLETDDDVEDDVPAHQLHARGYHDLGEHWSLDGAAWFVDDIEAGDIPSYLRVDARLEWHPDAETRLALVLQNLFHDGDPEFDTSQFSDSNEIETAAFLQLTWSR